ncbi:MAG: SRPBCC domain-containing protein [Methanobacterium sp.]
MKTIKKVYKIAAPHHQVWSALVDSEIIDKWGGGPSKMNSNVGFQFQLWGGDIHGKNIEVEKEKKLVQEWFGGNWPKPSIATFTLKREDDETILELVQEDVPDEDANDIDGGWDEYYLGPMKKMLENK